MAAPSTQRPRLPKGKGATAFSYAIRLLRVSASEPRLVLLLLDNLVTTFGASFTLVALPFLVMRLTGRAFDLGVTAAIEALPALCFLLFFPRLLDRMQPLRVLWICRLLFVGTNTAICSLTYLGLMSIHLVYLMAMLGGIVWAVAFPAGRTVFSLYIRKGLLPAGNAMLALISGLTTATLPLLAGSLVLASRGNEGLAIAFGVDAASVALSLPLLAAVGRRGMVRGGRSALPAPIAAITAAGVPRSFYAYLLISALLVFGPVQILLPIILVARHDSRYLLIYLAQFSGIAVAATLAATTSQRMPQIIRRMLACWGVAALAYLLLSTSIALAPVLAAFFLLAAASNIYGIQSQSWLQTATAAQHMGHAMTWLSAVTLGSAPVAALLTGALIDAIHFTATTWLLAALIVLATILGGVHQRRRFTQRGEAQVNARRAAVTDG